MASFSNEGIILFILHLNFLFTLFYFLVKFTKGKKIGNFSPYIMLFSLLGFFLMYDIHPLVLIPIHILLIPVPFMIMGIKPDKGADC